jgi:ketosteroid isomerase-like protein
MSEENVEIVRRAFDAWNSRDNDTGFSLVDPEIEVEVNLNSPIDGIYRGQGGLAKFMTEFWGQFETYRSDFVESIPADENVIIKVHHHGTGRGSGVEVEMLNWQVFTFRDGRIFRWRNFNTREQALEAAGLSE